MKGLDTNQKTETGGVRFLLGSRVCSTYTVQCPQATGSVWGQARGARSKGTEGEAWTWDGGGMDGDGSGIEAMTRMPPGLQKFDTLRGSEVRECKVMKTE